MGAVRKARKWNPSLHPRDSRGRFTRSVTRMIRPADRNNARRIMAGFEAPPLFGDVEASAYLRRHYGEQSEVVARYRTGSWRDVNRALRAGGGHPDVGELDAAMQPLPSDLLLTRHVPLAMFGDRRLEDLDRMVVRDAAYAPTTLGSSNSDGSDVTMHIVAPAGTRAVADPDTRDVILDRDTEMAVTRIEANGNGGYDMYLVVLPRRGQEIRGQAELDLSGRPVDPIADTDLTRLTDDELFGMFSDLSSQDGIAPEAFLRLAEEMDRRERPADGPVTPNGLRVGDQVTYNEFGSPATYTIQGISDGGLRVDLGIGYRVGARDVTPLAEGSDDGPYGWPDPDDLTPEQRRLDELLDSGRDYLDAYAEVYDLDPAALAREASASASIDRRAGETLDQAARRAYDEWVHLQYLRAEEATRGHMLSPAGRAAGIDPVSLFSGASSRARKYASEDLLRWWADNVRMTFTEFKAQTLGREADVRASERTRLQGNARDFI